MEKQSGICERVTQEKGESYTWIYSRDCNYHFPQPVYCHAFKIVMSLGLKADVLQALGGYRSLTSRKQRQFSGLGVSCGSVSCNWPKAFASRVTMLSPPPTSPFLPASLRDQQHPRPLFMLLSGIEIAVPHWCPGIIKQKNYLWWSRFLQLRDLSFPWSPTVTVWPWDLWGSQRSQAGTLPLFLLVNSCSAFKSQMKHHPCWKASPPLPALFQDCGRFCLMWHDVFMSSVLLFRAPKTQCCNLAAWQCISTLLIH